MWPRKLSNAEFDLLDELAFKGAIDIERCPTCDNRKIELAPGIKAWGHSTYSLGGEEHECDCEMQVTLRRHYLLAGIPDDYWTLDETDYYGDRTALGHIHEYLEAWEGNRRYGLGMEIYSPTTGNGKTMLASLIGKSLVKQGEKVFFLRFREIMGLYHLPYEVRLPTEERLKYSRVLILDEIGPGISDSQHAYFAEELENLIRGRVSSNRVTITTTNLTPEILEDEYPRAYSLLASKQKRIEVQFHDTRMAGEVLMRKDNRAKTGQTVPIK